jgi:hypothetical protein
VFGDLFLGKNDERGIFWDERRSLLQVLVAEGIRNLRLVASPYRLGGRYRGFSFAWPQTEERGSPNSYKKY